MTKDTYIFIFESWTLEVVRLLGGGVPTTDICNSIGFSHYRVAKLSLHIVISHTQVGHFQTHKNTHTLTNGAWKLLTTFTFCWFERDYASTCSVWKITDYDDLKRIVLKSNNTMIHRIIWKCDLKNTGTIWCADKKFIEFME